MATQAMPVVGLNLAETLHFGMPVTIASWWPVEQTVKRKFRTKPNGGHATDYVIPACPADATEPILVSIADAMELVYLGEKRHQEIPVPGGSAAVAYDIVKALCTNQFMATPDACPGIWVVEGGQRPTPAESAVWKRRQVEYANVCAKLGDDAYEKKNMADISTMFRVMAEWNRLDPQRHKWMRDEHRGDVKPCPFCRTSIDAESVKCEKCGEVVDVVAYRRMKQSMEESAGFTEAKIAEVKAIAAEQAEEPPPIVPPKPGTIIDKPAPGRPPQK